MDYKKAQQLFKYDEEGGRLLWWCRRPGVRVGKEAGFMLNGTKYITVDGERVIAKNVVWLLKTGTWPRKTLYHLDGNRTNIRFENLAFSKPKESRAETLLSIRKPPFGEKEVLVGGAVVGKSDDPEKLLALIRALLVY